MISEDKKVIFAIKGKLSIRRGGYLEGHGGFV